MPRDFDIEILKAQGVAPSLAFHIVSLFEGLEAENAQLRILLGASLEDSERLDWLEANPFMLYRDRDPGDGKLTDHFTAVAEDKEPRRGLIASTVREAIDQARNA